MATATELGRDWVVETFNLKPWNPHDDRRHDALRGLLEKSADAELLREMIGFAVERPMALGAGGLTILLDRERIRRHTIEQRRLIHQQHAAQFRNLMRRSLR